MSPIFFEIGNLSIRWYGVMAALGFLAASILLEKNRRFVDGLTKDQCGTMMIIALIAGILGARIYHVIEFFHVDGFDRDPVTILYIHRGGLVFFGGFILAFISVVLYTIKNKLDTIRILDIFVPSLTAAHAFGRIGCFLNGCCHGKVTGSFWGVPAPAGSKLAGLMVHPVQLLEAGENIILCILFCLFLKKGAKRGTVISSYLITYGILRFINETLRIDEKYILNLTGAQCISLLLIILGAGLLFYSLRHDRKKA